MRDPEHLGSRFPHPVEIIGVVAGVLPIFVHLGTVTRKVSEGRILVRYSDPLTVVAGALALLAALVALIFIQRTAPARKPARVGAIALLLLLGGFQVARGFGKVAPPAELAAGLRSDAAVGDELLQRKDAAGALEAYERGCDFGAAVGCFNAGQLHAAAALSAQACELGSAEGCGALGVAYVFGEGASNDLARAGQLFEKGCAGKDPVSCKNLGGLSSCIGTDPRSPVFRVLTGEAST